MPTPIPMTPLDFVNLLYAGSAFQSGFIEFRYLPQGTPVRDWMPYPIEPTDKRVWTVKKAPKGRNIYFGISIRKEEGEWKNVGGNENCHPTHLVWVDIDLKGSKYLHGDMHPENWSAEDLRAAAEEFYRDTLEHCAKHGLEKTRAIVYSGGGLQLYWAREHTTTQADTIRFNKKVIALFEESDDLHDPARIFRVPGSLHVKNKQRPIEVEVWQADPTAFISDETLLALPDPPEKEKPAPVKSVPLTAPQQAQSTQQEKVSVVEAFNSRYSIHDVLARYGYKQESSTRYTRPGEGASPGGVHLIQNKRGIWCSWHHSSNDPIPNREYLHEPFDVFCWMEHGGDWKGAAKAAARELGIAYQSTPKKHTQERPQFTPEQLANMDQAGLEHVDPNAPLTLTEYRDLFLKWAEVKEYRFKFHQKRRAWYRYQAGVYVEVLDEVMLQTVDKAFQSLGFKNLRTAFLKEILDKVSREFEIGAAEEDLKPTELNVQNGILDLASCTLRPHSPDFFSTIQSAATYQPDIHAYDWEEFLEEAIPSKQDRLILQMYSGLCLTAITEPQKALMLIGEGGTGKGTFVSVLETVLGGLATSSALENIKDGSFLIGNLVSRRMCVVDEIARHIDWLPFKRITGEASITIDVKNKTPYTEKLAIKLIVLSNVLPLLGEDATNTSLTRRMLIVPFNVKPKSVDPGLKKRLTSPIQLSGVLNWMIEGWQKLQESGLRFPDPESNHIQREMTARSNHVIFYAEECLVRSKDGWIAAAELYDHYKQWANDNGYRVFANNKFASEMFPAAMRELGFQDVSKQKTNKGAVWNGVQIKL